MGNDKLFIKREKKTNVKIKDRIKVIVTTKL